MYIQAAKLWLNHGRLWWSNHYAHKQLNKVNLKTQYNPTSAYVTLSRATKDLFPYFNYSLQLNTEYGDTVRSPAQCYAELTNGGLTDDCDGYHAALLYVAAFYDFECYLLTFITKNIKESHSILVAKDNNSYTILDYDKLFLGKTFEEAWLKYLAWKPIQPVLFYNTISWNFEKRIWELKKIA